MANEKRLIDLDKAFGAINQEVWWTESEKAYFRSFLAKQPKVDAVEVVRCKDCNNFVPESITVCRHCSLTGMQVVDDDDFCSYGERRTDE